FKVTPSPEEDQIQIQPEVATSEAQEFRQLRRFEKLDAESQPEQSAPSPCPSSTGICSPGRVSPELGQDVGEDVEDPQSDFEPDEHQSDNSSNSSSEPDSEEEDVKAIKRKGDSSSSPPAKRKRGRYRKNPSDPPRPKANCPYSSKYTLFYKEHPSGRSLCFKCKLCSAILRQKAKIIQHLQLHESGDGSPCPQCGWLVPNNRLKDHNAKFHPKENDGKARRYLFCCSKCPAQYIEKNELRKHLQLHENSSEGCTKCEICGWLVRTRVLGRHKSDHHGKDSEKNKKSTIHPKKSVSLDIPYYCSYCQMIYTSLGQLQKHFLTFHVDKEGFLYCGEEECSEKFESKQLLKFHMDKAHPDKNPAPPEETEQGEQSCQHCQTVFASKMEVDYHIAVKHRDILLTCTTCNIKFSSYHFYRKHMETTRIHATTKGFSCELCGRSFYSGLRLNYHRRQVHYAELGLDPCQCPECGLILCESSTLKTHIKMVHRQEKNYSCEYCGKAFSIPQMLKVHLKRFHEGPLGAQELPEGKHYRVEVGESQEKIWLCELCPVKFLAMSQVRKHLLSAHYYELKYICEGCGRRFCAAMGLHHHRKSCEGLKEGGTPGEKFTCDVCPKTFQTSDQRHLHERRRHKSNSGGVSHLCPVCGRGFRQAGRLAVHQQTCGVGPYASELNTY
ncbi:putative zinc finger protein, partial [Orchesella cincta]